MDEDKIIQDYEAGEVSNQPSHPDDVKIGVDKLRHDVYQRKDGTRYAVYPSATSTSYSAKINPNANSEWWDESNIARDENGRRFYGSTPEEAQAKYEYYKYQQRDTHGGWNGWDMFNATTGGIFNQLSPTQFGRNLYNITTGNPNYAQEWVYGNNGLVSDEFAANNPMTSTFLNLLGDVAVFSAPNIARNVGNMGRTVSRWPRQLKKAYQRGDLIFDRTSDRFRNVHQQRMQNYADMYQDALSNQQALNAERTALEGELKSQFSTSPRFRSAVMSNPQSYWTRFDPTTGKFMLKTDGPVSDQFVQRDLLLNLENSYGAEMSDIRNAARQATRNFSKRWGNNGAAEQYQSVTVHTMPERGRDPDTDYTWVDFINGLDKAKRFLNSGVRKDSFKHNMELARRLGFKDLDEAVTLKDASRVSKPPRVRIVNDPALSVNARVQIQDYDNPNLDEVLINLANDADVELSAFHEQLHRGGYGAQGVLKDPSNLVGFYKMKSDKLKKPWNQQPPGRLRDYLINPGEMAVNMAHYGQEMGIPVGGKYPGKKQFEDMIFNHYHKAKVAGKPSQIWMIPYLNWKKPKRIWDALSGQYFSVPLGVGVGYETLKNQTEESN